MLLIDQKHTTDEIMTEVLKALREARDELLETRGMLYNVIVEPHGLTGFAVMERGTKDRLMTIHVEKVCQDAITPTTTADLWELTFTLEASKPRMIVQQFKSHQYLVRQLYTLADAAYDRLARYSPVTAANRPAPVPAVVGACHG